MATNDQGETIELSSLTVQQLEVIQDQFAKEYQNFKTNFTALKTAIASFENAKDSLSEFKPENSSKEMLMPLTSALYVKAKMKNVDTIMIDIGTGYFVEKSIPEANDYIERKITSLSHSLKQCEGHLITKQHDLETVTQYIRHRTLANAEKTSENKNVIEDAVV